MLTRLSTTHFVEAPTEPGIPSRRISQPSRRTGPWSLVIEAGRRHRSRQLLTRLDAHMLKDIGVTFTEAEHEANKPFWVR